jgi:hypothetical protein
MKPAERGGKQLVCSAAAVSVMLCFFLDFKDEDNASPKRRAVQTSQHYMPKMITRVINLLFLDSKDVDDVFRKRRAVSEPPSFVTQKTTFFMFNAVRTSNQTDYRYS